ncbi:hypothetical protein [Thermococcus peptonophilus]
MTWDAARRIQSAVDSGRAVKADGGFKSRAMSAAARNFKKDDEDFEDFIVDLISEAQEDEIDDVDDVFDIGNWF